MSTVVSDRSEAARWESAVAASLWRVRYCTLALDAALARIVEVVSEAVPTLHGAGLVVVRGANDGLLWVASPAVDYLERQLGNAGGPAFQAVATNQRVVIDDLDDEPRWPALAAAAGAEGLAAIVALPLCGVHASAAVTYYLAQPPGEDAHQALEAVAGAVAVAVDNALAFARYELVTSHLHEALESRDIIGQAKGMLMERFGVSAEEAFGVLRATSQRANRKLRDVAADVIEGETVPWTRTR